MLLTRDLIKDVDKKYIPMLKAVNIPDFTKCIALFSGLRMDRVSDAVIKNYLLTWAKNKYRFYKMLGNSLRKDVPFDYTKFSKDFRKDYKLLETEYPIYSLWLDAFSNQENNKIENYDIDYSAREIIRRVFPNTSLNGTTVTHFFKKFLKAPDELVTKIAGIYENTTVNATFTLSIDPVDMMLASENPYDWSSCYCLDTSNTDSHADGCLAAVLDSSSLIDYIWNSTGEMKLYHCYNFKNVRFKRMRQWIAISPSFSSIHYNTIYPRKMSLR